MNRSHRKTSLQSFVVAALALIAVLCGCAKTPFETEVKAHHHLVILGDPHLPGRDLENKKQVLTTINSWEDVEMVIAVGDICADFGTDAEYVAAKEFFSALQKPLFPIAGNHDYIYESPSGPNAKLSMGLLVSQTTKLRQFRNTFGLANHYYSKNVGEYLLIFLSADHENYLSGMSDQEISWLRSELAKNPEKPTIIIFHGPLRGTLRDYKRFVNTPNFVAQPTEIIHEVLKSNPQVFLWISGHTHTPPLEESYASPVNVYAGQVTNIHNKDMNRGTIWTNSLFLYPDRVEVKTFNHQEKRWLPELNRTITLPKP
jgi:DNA repair exonuclease SbcCD nuclease subunit